MNISNDDAIGTADAPEIKAISDQISEKGPLCRPPYPLSPPLSHHAGKGFQKYCKTFRELGLLVVAFAAGEDPGKPEAGL